MIILAAALALCAQESPRDSEAPLRLESEPAVVLPLGQPGTWDSSSIYGPTVLEHGNLLHMYYVGNQVVAPNDPTKNMGLGYATSKDGRSWTKHGRGPVLVHPEARRATGCAAFVEEERWILLYGVPAKDYYLRGEVYLAVGPGPTGPFEARPEPVLTPPDEGWNASIKPLNLFRVDGEYRLYYYSLNRELGTSGFGLATSSDLETWLLLPEPLLTPGASGTWDGIAVTSASVLRNGEAWEMFYVGYDRPITQRAPDDLPLGLGRATSADGLHWTKDPANPVLPTSQTIWPLTSVVRRGAELLFFQDTDGGLEGISFFRAGRSD